VSGDVATKGWERIPAARHPVIVNVASCFELNLALNHLEPKSAIHGKSCFPREEKRLASRKNFLWIATIFEGEF
jgi:hypothetical protein